MQIKLTLTLVVCFTLMAEMVSAATTHKPERADDYAAHLITLINQYRQRHHLPQLVADARLTSLAQEHVLAMAEQRQLSHDGFDSRIKRANSRRCVENVGWNYPRAETQLAAWRTSPGHNVNLLNTEVNRVGVAVFRGYVTYFACAT